MKRNEVKVGGVYVAKVSGRLVEVRLLRESPYGGWEALSLATGRTVRIKTAGRLRRPAERPLQPGERPAPRGAPSDWIGCTVIDTTHPGRPRAFTVEEIERKDGEPILVGHGLWCYARAAALSTPPEAGAQPRGRGEGD
jgi:hypothetical protein